MKDQSAPTTRRRSMIPWGLALAGLVLFVVFATPAGQLLPGGSSSGHRANGEYRIERDALWVLNKGPHDWSSLEIRVDGADFERYSFAISEPIVAHKVVKVPWNYFTKGDKYLGSDTNKITGVTILIPGTEPLKVRVH